MKLARQAMALTMFAVAFGTNVATPLLLIYEVDMGLSTWTVTALFAIYPIGLAPALAIAGPVSDAYGRRAVTFPGLVLSGLASVSMIFGDGNVVLLYTGRFLLGAVSGLVFVVGSAWMQELGRPNPLWNARLLGMLMYGGFGAGPLIAGILAQWGPWPLVLPYLVHLAVVVAALLMFSTIPETVPVDEPRPKISPNLGIPDGASSEFWRVVVPCAAGVFTFPSLTFGLFPVLLRPAMADIAVFMTGIITIVAMWLIIPAQLWVGRVGPYRAAPIGLAVGTFGTGLGLVAFATGSWGILFPAAMCMGTGSGISMTSGLRLVEHLTAPRQRGALTGSFYAAAYAGMTMPLVASTIAKAVGFETVLAALTTGAGLLAVWLVRATAGKRVPEFAEPAIE